MKPHLSDVEVLEMLLDEALVVGDHLEQCAPCRSELQQLRRTLETLPSLVHTTSERPEAFWQLQRNAIRARIVSPKPVRRSPSLAWAAVAVVVTLAGLLLSNSPAPTPTQAQVDPDHELLIEIERAVSNDGPEALQPAALLVQEISQNAQPISTSPVRKKETNHEN